MNTESIKELEDPESTREFKTISGSVSDVKESVSESGFERAVSRINLARNNGQLPTPHLSPYLNTDSYSPMGFHL